MSQKIKTFILYTSLILLIITALYIIGYYFWVNQIDEIRTLPPGLLSAVIIYIAIQLIKRFFQQETHWHYWLYYVGLVAIIIPLPLFKLEDNWIFWVTRIGTMFLLFQPLLELYLLRKSSLSK